MNNINEKATGEAVGFPILDSRLISPTILKKYAVKLVDCGEYTQVYIYDNYKYKSQEKYYDKLDELSLKKKKIVNDFEQEITKNKSKQTFGCKIETKNIIRSKLNCQRLAKCNMNKWKTFITLTFKENIKDIKIANKLFSYYIDSIRRIKKDFAYIAIPEFQKRGAAHYHLLTNLEVDSKFIPHRPLKRLYNPSDNSWKNLEYYDLPYWKNGFSSAESIEGDIKKIVGYISKYMTKDCDERLFNHHRYMNSRNLTLPKENFLDLSLDKDNEFYIKKIQDKEQIYHNEYVNPFDGSLVTFLEFRSSSKNIISQT